MALPAAIGIAAKYGPAAYGILKGLLGGKSPQQKAQERLQRIAERGLDPSVLSRAIAILNARNQAEQGGVLSRLAAGGIDPSSGLAQEAVGATRRSLGARQGEAQTLFNEQSQAAQMRANEQLAGMPEDTSTGDLIGSLLSNLEAQGVFDKKKVPDYGELQNRLQVKDLPTAPRGSMFSQNLPTATRLAQWQSRRTVNDYLPKKLINPYYRP